eukprot:COSAG06_NODE_28_length_32009_cov_31.553463_17_plen_53_part_00
MVKWVYLYRLTTNALYVVIMCNYVYVHAGKWAMLCVYSFLIRKNRPIYMEGI